METRIENWNGYDIRFVNLDGETIQDVIDSMNEKQKKRYVLSGCNCKRRK